MNTFISPRAGAESLSKSSATEATGSPEERTTQATSPVQTREGFTLVETLIALLVASILLTVSASALIKILRAEGTAGRMQEASLAMQTLGCRAALGDETAAEIPQVSVQRHDVKASGSQWTVWDITCTSIPPFSATLEFPAPLP